MPAPVATMTLVFNTDFSRDEGDEVFFNYDITSDTIRFLCDGDSRLERLCWTVLKEDMEDYGRVPCDEEIDDAHRAAAWLVRYVAKERAWLEQRLAEAREGEDEEEEVAPQPVFCPKVTEQMLKHTRDQNDGCSLNWNTTADFWRDFWNDMLHDFPEEYDADWYPLVGTAAIASRINWQSIADTINDEALNDYIHDLFA